MIFANKRSLILGFNPTVLLQQYKLDSLDSGILRLESTIQMEIMQTCICKSYLVTSNPPFHHLKCPDLHEEYGF